MGTWYNNDGLYIKYGTSEAEHGKGGAFAADVAGQHVVELDITLTNLTTSPAILDDNVFLPKGYTITKVETVATVAATSGGAAALNIGLIRKDRSTAIDADGIVAALALTAIDAVGETTVLTKGSTGAGALVGTVTSADYPSYITADYDTAAYTAGVVKVRIWLQKV